MCKQTWTTSNSQLPITECRSPSFGEQGNPDISNGITKGGSDTTSTTSKPKPIVKKSLGYQLYHTIFKDGTMNMPLDRLADPQHKDAHMIHWHWTTSLKDPS
jgi:hypothetical protein